MWSADKRHFEQSISATSQMRELTEARAAFDWLRQGSAAVQQAAIRDLDRAFVNFFTGRAAYPRWRKASSRQGFAVRDLRLRRTGRRMAEILVPKVGWVRFRLTRAWNSLVSCTSARIDVGNDGRWHVSLVCLPGQFRRHVTGREVGVDRGVRNTMSLSMEGIHLHAPTLTNRERALLLNLQRRLSRQQRGSRRREATRMRIADMYSRLSRRQKDWIEKTTTDLVRGYDLIAIEALDVKAMTRRPHPIPDPTNEDQYRPNGANRKTGLNRAIRHSCWGLLDRRLADKAAQSSIEAPCNLVRVSPRNTSRQCHECGHIDAANRKSQAFFACQKCGYEAHADTNAARNILRAAQNVTNPRVSGDRAHQSRSTSNANHLRRA